MTMRYELDSNHEFKVGDPDGYAIERERARIRHWHETFNAAITGLSTRMKPGSSEHVVLYAKDIANEAHGPL